MLDPLPRPRGYAAGATSSRISDVRVRLGGCRRNHGPEEAADADCDPGGEAPGSPGSIWALVCSMPRRTSVRPDAPSLARIASAAPFVRSRKNP